jgi:tubulin-specific chaperone D
MANGLVAYAQTLPVAADKIGAFDIISLIDSLADLSKRNFSNNNIVVPVFQAFNILLEGDVVQRLSQHPLGIQRYRS